LPRPWTVSKVLPPSNDSVYSYILGNQHLNKGNLDGAEKLLKKAHNEDPLSLKYALSYGNLLYKKKEYLQAKDILIPFSKDPQNNYPSLFLLGVNCQALGEYEEAISYYKEYLIHSGMNLNILNSIGQCYYQLGNTKDALATWQKSLEINPNQEDLKKLVDQLKKN
jgi:tetratricopeptide (TPR) repeat protein